MMKSLAVFGASLALGACAVFAPPLVPGKSTAEDVRLRYGRPNKVWPNADGTATWEFPTGPMGYYTWMVRMGADGRVLAVENVLDESTGFVRVRPVKDTRDDVRRLLGPPMMETYFPRQNEYVWDYRYLDVWGYASRFYVYFDPEGKVIRTGRGREYRGRHWM